MSTLTDGTVTPRARPAQPDTPAIRELLGSMKNTLDTLGQTLDTLNEQSQKISTLGPTMNDTSREIQALRREIRRQDKKQEVRIQEVKKLVREGLKQKVSEHMKSQIQEQIKAEISAQVAEQVDVQIKEYIPVPLHLQATESKKQLGEVHQSLTNSEARRSNSNLRITSEDEPLAVVLKADGKKSDLFPADLRSLFSYDVDMAKELVKDHGLQEDEVLEINFNRFMTHIGIPFQLIPFPEPGEENGAKVEATTT